MPSLAVSEQSYLLLRDPHNIADYWLILSFENHGLTGLSRAQVLWIVHPQSQPVNYTTKLLLYIRSLPERPFTTDCTEATFQSGRASFVRALE
jgi:hypothetical protein